MRAFASGLALVLISCGAAAPAPSRPPAAEAGPVAQSEPEAAALTAREQTLEGELRADVTALVKIGERNVDKKWELASAADWLADQVEAAGLALHREGYEVGDVAAQNLAVEVRGSTLADQVVVVGAHYDTATGSPGADDNASGVAALLALARHFSKRHPARTLRFVWFVNEEPPYFQTQEMGSLVYAKALAARGETAVAMVSLESIGFYSDAPGSQRYPEALAAKHPAVGNFIAVVGDERSAPLVERFAAAMKKSASLPVESDSLPADLPGVGWSDHWAFWQIGVPAIMVTDTAPFRYPHYHKPTDTLEQLDFARMARVTHGLEGALEMLANDKGLGR
jgi:hypothetical protein